MMMVRGDAKPDGGPRPPANSLECLPRRPPDAPARLVLTSPVMTNYTAPDPNSQPLEAVGRCGGIRAPHRDLVGEAKGRATCEYPHGSEQDPNLNDVSSASGSESSA